MILLHVLQLLEDEGLGTIDQDLFYGKAPIVDGESKTGVVIFERGGNVNHRNTGLVQTFDMHSRHQFDTYAADQLEKILEKFQELWPTCTLPQVPQYSTKTYENTTINPITNVENLGLDEEGRNVYRLSGEVIYRKG